jgi:hypothetical protein
MPQMRAQGLLDFFEDCRARTMNKKMIARDGVHGKRVVGMPLPGA